jgi:uncharacterized protein affecting Mg2+/Co2+ transport
MSRALLPPTAQILPSTESGVSCVDPIGIPTKRTHATTTTTTTTTAADPAAVRLYRILLRQCRDLASPSRDAQILLQPPLHPHAAGLSRVATSSLPYAVTPRHVLRLFGHWRQRELRATSVADENDEETGSVRHDYDDDNAFQQATKDQAEEERLFAWLTPALPDAATDAWEDETLWTTPDMLLQAVRQAYRQAPAAPAADQRTWAIRAFQYLVTQGEMLQRLVTVHEEAGVRLVTVARCVGRSATATRSASPDNPVIYKYRFVYRIRIENTSLDQTVQLLGRSWIIQEGRTRDDHSLGTEQNSIKVHAPHTGAVGQHPVLAPGQFFEYMSGCDLATESGLMQGCFHFCHVPPGTPPARVGQTVPAIHGGDTAARFEVPVAPFPLEPDRQLHRRPGDRV